MIYSVLKTAFIFCVIGLTTGFETNSMPFQNPAGDTGQQGVQIQLDEQNKKALVNINGEHFTTYRYGDEHRIPMLWPVHAENGITITRNWPMGEDEPESTDHRHHTSIWTAYGDVNGFDHWHNEPIISQNVTVSSGQSSGVVRARNVWVDDADNPIVDERRTYRFHNTPASARIFDQSVTFRASYGDVRFGDDKEGLIAFRIRPEIQGNRAGMLMNARGERGEDEVYGTPVEWMDYSGYVEGAGNRGITLFVHPDNFRLPAWHVRDYGLAGCNFFAMQDVAGLEEGTYILPQGAELTFHVRFLIHSGDMSAERIQEFYEEYINTPVSGW